MPSAISNLVYQDITDNLLFGPPPSAAQVIRQFLIDQDLVVDSKYTTPDNWPCVTGSLPPDHDNYVVVRDLGAIQEGRIQQTGQRVTHPKIQIIVRSYDYDIGINQGNAIEALLDRVGITVSAGGIGTFLPVFVRGYLVILQAVHIEVVLSPAGSERDTNRELFSLTAATTILPP